MKKIIIDPHNCSREEHRELIDYLLDKCWDFKEEPITAFSFSVQDTIEYAKNEMNIEVPLTNKIAEEILKIMANKADLSIGISWDTLEYYINLYFEES